MRQSEAQVPMNQRALCWNPLFSIDQFFEEFFHMWMGDTEVEGTRSNEFMQMLWQS